MTIPITKERFIITVSGGTGTANTMKHSGTELVQLLIEAASTTNIFDFSLIDEDGDSMYDSLAIEGGLEEHGIYLPMRGIYTIQITNATIDEDIVVKLLMDS